MGSHRTPPNGPGIHRLPSLPLQSLHRGQLHPTQVAMPIPIQLFLAGVA